MENEIDIYKAVQENYLNLTSKNGVKKIYIGSLTSDARNLLILALRFFDCNKYGDNNSGDDFLEENAQMVFCDKEKKYLEDNQLTEGEINNILKEQFIEKNDDDDENIEYNKVVYELKKGIDPLLSVEHFNSMKDIKYLTDLLNHPDWYLRLVAAEALGKLAIKHKNLTDEIVQIFIDIISNEDPSNPSDISYVIETPIKTLVAIGKPAIPALYKMLNTAKYKFIKDIAQKIINKIENKK